MMTKSIFGGHVQPAEQHAAPTVACGFWHGVEINQFYDFQFVTIVLTLKNGLKII